jgi:uncharacterized membrane protein YqaE (UPF0057 family)
MCIIKNQYILPTNKLINLNIMKKTILLLAVLIGFGTLSLSAKTNTVIKGYTAEMLYNFTAKNINTITPDALKTEIKKLSLKEKKRLFNMAYNQINQAQKNGTEVDKVLLYVLAVFIPPVAVGLHTNWETTPVLINIILTLLGWLPGVVHAFYVILT